MCSSDLAARAASHFVVLAPATSRSPVPPSSQPGAGAQPAISAPPAAETWLAPARRPAVYELADAPTSGGCYGLGGAPITHAPTVTGVSNLPDSGRRRGRPPFMEGRLITSRWNRSWLKEDRRARTGRPGRGSGVVMTAASHRGVPRGGASSMPPAACRWCPCRDHRQEF